MDASDNNNEKFVAPDKAKNDFEGFSFKSGDTLK